MAINANNFFNLEQEARTQGTLGGKKLTKEERKEAFKKQGKIEFKTFVEKVLNKKEPTVTPKALGGGGATGVLPSAKSKEGKERSEVAERVANAFDSRLEDLLKNIREDVGGILTVVEKQVDIEEDTAAEAKQEDEKSKRKEKEDKSEKEKKPKTSGFVETLTKPVKGLWESIVGGFMKLLAGWGITKFLEWFGNPKNKENVEAFKEFIVNAVPVILKGILAIIALDIGLKVLKFAKLIAAGSAKLLTGLLGLSNRIIAWAASNPWIAGAIGLGLITYGIGKMIGKDKQVENLTEEKQTKMNALVDGGMDAGSAEVLADSTRLRDAGGYGSVNNMRNQSDMLGIRNNPSGLTPNDFGSSRFNQGGFVSGPDGVDRVPAKLTAGEFVMSRGAVEEWGASTLANMNAAGGGTNKPKSGNRFEGGGLVKGPSDGGFGMTAKSGWIGSDAKENRFTGPKNEAYFLQVSQKTGLTEVWNEEMFQDRLVGTIDPNTKQWKYTNWLSWSGPPRDFEKKFFDRPANKDMVLEKSKDLINASAKAGEISKQKANTLINNPPGRKKKDKGKVVPVTTSGGGGGSQGGGGGGGEVPQEIMFSAIDKQNHYRSMVAAMCNILEDV